MKEIKAFKAYKVCLSYFESGYCTYLHGLAVNQFPCHLIRRMFDFIHFIPIHELQNHTKFHASMLFLVVIPIVPDIHDSGKSQALIDVEIAAAYIGNSHMPHLFGILANELGICLFPIYL